MLNSNSLKLGAIIAIIALMTSGCSGVGSSKSVNASSAASNTQFMQAKMSISVAKSGSVIYSDSTPNSSLVMKAGQSYTLNLAVQNAPANTSYQVVATNLDQVNPTPISMPVSVGPNTISVPSQGNYQLKLMATASGYNSQSKIYQAQVTCANPSFTADSLSNINISVSGTNNDYNFSATGIAPNGQGPYQCAWDMTGTGIIDSVFSDCSSGTAALAHAYVNLVTNRNVGLVVRDACNAAYTVSKPAVLNYSEPAMGQGNVFIQAQLSNAGGLAVGDRRVDGVTYYSQNTAAVKPVAAQYGTGSFTIFSWLNYHMNSSVNFGMQIKLSGIVETTPLDASTGAGAVSVANAKLSSINFVTDQAGDQSASLSFSGKNCVLTNQNAKVIPVSGQPCTGGTSGDNNKLTVEVWGHYSCTGLTASDASTDISGDFDGYYDMADSCSGGGQGGGGIPPHGV